MALQPKNENRNKAHRNDGIGVVAKHRFQRHKRNAPACRSPNHFTEHIGELMGLVLPGYVLQNFPIVFDESLQYERFGK